MEKLADFLIEASTKLGVQATRVWPDLVKIVWIQCIFYSIIAVITIIACYRAIRFLTRMFVAPETSGEARIVIGLGTAIVFGVGILAFTTLGDNLSGVFFPEAKYVSYLVSKFASK